MSPKTEMRDGFYAAVLPIVRSELPGIRGDLHRKISRAIAEKIATRTAALADENKRLLASEKALTDRLDKASRQKPGIPEIEKAIAALEKAKDKINGEAQQDD